MKGKLKLLKLGLLGVVFLFASCEQEKNYMKNGNEKSIIQTVSLADIPAISQAISAKHSAHSITNKNSVDYLSLIIPDKVVVITDKNGYKTYTLGLNLPSTDKLQNLVVAETPTGIKYYLSSYTSSNLPQFLDEIDAKIKPSQIFDASYEALDIADAKLIIHCKFSCPSGQHTDPSDSDCDYDISLWDEHCAYGGDISFGGGISGGGGGVHTAGGGNTDVNTNSSNGSAGSSSNDGTNVPMTTVPVHGHIVDTPCTQLKAMCSKPIANVTPAKTVLTDLQYLASNVTQHKEMMYAMQPTGTDESQFIDNYLESLPNGDEIHYDPGTNAISMIIHTHWDPVNHYSVFSLSDIYQVCQSIHTGNIFNPITFTAIVITAQGTKYALKITDAGAFKNWGDGFFDGWSAGDKLLIDKGEKIYDLVYGISLKSNPVKNEIGLVKFLAQQNLGAELYKADNNFNWSKLTFSNNTVVPTPCY